MSRVAIIGGGPAGMMCASEAAHNGHSVTLYERNEKLGKKLFITGKGRCNLTNSADIKDFFENIPRNSRFLYSALYGFTNDELVAAINAEGVPTKVERGGRIFPQSDKSSDILRAMANRVKKAGVDIRLNSRVKAITKDEAGFIIDLGGKKERYDAVVLATGGASYTSTGSTGDGYAFAKAFGHSVTPILPSLISLETEEEWSKELMGLSLKNVTLNAYNKKKKLVYSELGEMLFTHFGVSGPLVLSSSAHMRHFDKKSYRLELDLKPALDEQQLDKEGLIIDDRANGGGNVSPMILERLSREPYRLTMGRGTKRVGTIPDAVQVGPKVCLINKYSASDGDLFPWGFRALGLGKLIGTRTWGGIVGISGPLPYMDGTDIRVPFFTSYDAKTGQWIIENHGVDPDILIDNDPVKEWNGEDEQLNKAIEEVMKELQNRKPLPPVPAPRDFSK